MPGQTDSREEPSVTAQAGKSDSTNRKGKLAAKLSVVLPIAAGLLLTIMFFQTIVGAFPGFPLIMMGLALLVWGAGIGAAFYCFSAERKKFGVVGIALSFVATPLIPYMIVLLFSPEQRGVYVEISQALSRLIESDRHVLPESDARLYVTAPSNNYFGEARSATFGQIYAAYVPKPGRVKHWSNDGRVLTLTTGSFSGSKMWSIDVVDRNVLSILGVDQTSAPMQTAGETVLLRDEFLHLVSPETGQQTTSLEIRDRAAFATHPATDLIVVGEGGIESARLIHLPSRTQLKVLRRSDVAPAAYKMGNSSTQCAPNFNMFEFTEDGKYFVTTNSGSIGGKSISFMDAFYAVKDQDLEFVGYRFQLPDDLQERYRRGSSRGGGYTNVMADYESPQNSDGFGAQLGKLTYWDGSKFAPATIEDDSGSTIELQARTISPSGAYAIAYSGDSVYLAVYDADVAGR